MYGSELLEYDVTDNVPALEGEDLEECEHGVADVVEVEVARIRPESVRNTEIVVQQVTG